MRDPALAIQSLNAPAVLSIAGLWLLLVPYAGIVGDARMYALQLMAAVHPLPLGHDIFLRPGSQDQYSLFSTLCSPLVARWGIETSAQALTLAGQAAFLISCWRFGLTVAGVAAAWAVTCLVLILPGHYGAAGVFWLVEPFMTPRPFAQALTLCALAAWFGRHHRMAIAALVVATLVHPLMAAPGWVLVGWLKLQQFPREVWRVPSRPLAAFGFTALGALAGGLYWLLHGNHGFTFDTVWLAQVTLRAPYLFLASWQRADWGGAMVPLVTLWITSRHMALTDLQRGLATAAMGTCVFGLVLSAIGVDLLHITLLTQGQPWRWLWLGTVIALVSLPVLLPKLWLGGTQERTLCILLAAAWLARYEPLSLELSLLTLTAGVAWVRRWGSDPVWRKWFIGTCLLSAVTLVYLVALSTLAAQEAESLAGAPEGSTAWQLLRTHRIFTLAAVALAAWGLHCLRRRGVQWVASILLSLGGASAIAHAATSRPAHTHPVAAIERMAAWRQFIPQKEEVFWYDQPETVWLQLQRASYLSSAQTPVALFSRDAAAVLRQRAEEIRSVTRDIDPLSWNEAKAIRFSTTSLAQICDRLHVNYLVTREKLDQPPLDSMAGREFGMFSGLHLYRCDRAQTAPLP